LNIEISAKLQALRISQNRCGTGYRESDNRVVMVIGQLVTIAN